MYLLDINVLIALSVRPDLVFATFDPRIDATTVTNGKKHIEVIGN
ncbi:MAG: hypothetical protein AAF236_10560 [Verrucomicrobiota bacterium]